MPDGDSGSQGRKTRRVAVEVGHFRAPGAGTTGGRRTVPAAIVPPADGGRPLTFGHPLLLVALLALPALGVVHLIVRRRGMRHAVTFTNVDLLAEVAGRPSRLRHLPTALFSLALAAACVATARPEVSARAPARDSTVILVIDASLSMQATDVRPSRLGAAEDAVRAFVDRVPQGMRIGLVDFSGDAQVGATPTDDRAQLLVAVRSVGRYTGFGGTAIGDALVRAVRLGEGRDASILFLSDGKQNRGIVRPLAGARRARDAGMRVYTVALGTTHGRLPASLGFGRQVSSAQSLAPDPTTLRAISELTGGSFFSARTAAGARSAYAELGSRLGWRRSTREVTYEVLGLAALLLVAAWGLSLRSRPRLP